MTEIARELLEDIQPGDFVHVRYGTDSDQTLYEGTIIKWTENFLSLFEENGEITRIRLDDNLRALKKKQKAASPKHASEDILGSSVQNELQITNNASQISRKMVTLLPQQTYNVTFVDCVENARKKVKLASNSELKKIANGVLDSLLHAIKNKEVANKYHNLRAKIILAQKECDCDADYESLYYILGVLSFVAEDYEYSIEPLVRAKEFLLASFSAKSGNMLVSAQVLSLCALLSKQSNDINQYIGDAFLHRRDVCTLKKLLEDNKTDQDMCEKLASCAIMLFSASGSKTKANITQYSSAYETAKVLLDSIPSEWQKERSALSWWEEFNKFNFGNDKKSEDPQETLIGYIYNFDSEKKFGFISPNHYFYVAQIYEDSERGVLLRKMLFLGLWENLEVEFKLGKSLTKGGDTSATAIELTEKGFNDAMNRIEQANQKGTILNGFVEDFTWEKMSGRIQSCGKKYNFKINAIIDPWLKAYYEKTFSPREQDVTFEVVGKYAINICWLNSDENEMDYLDGFITASDIEEWEEYLSHKDDKTEINLSCVDSFSSYSYRDLPEINNRDSIDADSFLAWNGKSLMESPLPAKNISAVEKVVPKKTITSAPVPRYIQQSQISFAERARKAVLEGNLEYAENEFKKALETEGFNEAVVCDYISLCIRLEGKIDRAIELLHKYEKHFTAEKLMNLKIQIYEKKKDYNVLCSLYEKAFTTASSISKKSHFLFRLIDAYIKIQKYPDALLVCKQWEQFYNQNRFREGAEKLKNAEPNINRQKAICFYNLGNVDEARKIATDLIRANPADIVASSILDGTFGKTDLDVDQETREAVFIESDIDYFDDEPTDANESQMSRFVRTLIQQTDIASVLKTSKIKEGRYIGTSKEGLEDVEKLVSGRKISSKTRSDSLLAACKLLDQIEQREDGSITNIHRKYRYSGRAMASWGDLMVSQLSQLDTTRMAYLYALKILTPTSRGAEQDWINSFNRYVKSYFLARVGVNSLEEYIVQQNNIRSKDGANTDILIGARVQPVLIPEFLVGILMIINVIENQQERTLSFIDDLFSKNIEIRKAIIHQISVMTDQERINDDIVSFRNGIFSAVNTLKKKQKELHGVIVDISSTILSQRLSDENLYDLDPDNWRNFLTATDLSRLNRIYYIVKRSQDYHASWDFENRSDCLRNILLESKELLETIRREPTDISYDVLLPALEQIVLKIADKQTDLYQDFLPKISWRETIQPFRTPDGQIQIQLTVENEMNYQSADTISIENVVGSEIVSFDKTPTIQTLRGGDEVEIGLWITISEAANISGSFSAKINYTYKCNDAPQSLITKNQDVEFTFIIRNENFEPLINPYSAYEGKVMEDDTMFVGRSNQIDEILNMICPNGNGDMNYGRAIAMYGQTRTGKSSLLYHIKKKLIERYQEDILVWDIGNIGELPESKEYIANFLYNVLYIGDEAIYENSSISKIVKEIDLAPPLEAILNEPDFAVTHFNTYMKKLNAVLKKEKKIIVLFVDEFTYLHGYIKEGKLTSDFMRFWKALLQNYCIFAVVAGQDDMPEFMDEYPNEFACMELMKLNYLDERDVKVLVQKPLEIANNRDGLFRNDGSIESLYNLTAGSAYLTVILCSKLVSYLNEKGAYMVTKGIINEFLRTKAFGAKGFLTEIHFEAQLQERGHRELDDINKTILLSIARASQAFGYADINEIECEGLSLEDIQKYVERLVDRNVLAKEGRDQYYIQVKLLERWLINTKGM